MILYSSLNVKYSVRWRHWCPQVNDTLVLALVPVLSEEGWNKLDSLIVVGIREYSEIGVERLR